MKLDNHALRTLKFDISFYAEEQALDLHKRISRLSNSKLYSVINKVCDDELPEQHVFVQIKELYIDLGSIPYSEVDQLLPNKLCDLFQQTLRHQLLLSNKLYDVQQTPDLKKTEREYDSALIIEFLQTGNLPWWASKEIEHQLEQMFLKALKDSPGDIIDCIYAGSNTAGIIQRIISQFSEMLLLNLVETLEPLHAPVLVKYVLLPALPDLNTSFDKKAKWKMLLTLLNPYDQRVRYERPTIESFPPEQIKFQLIIKELLAGSTNNNEVEKQLHLNKNDIQILNDLQALTDELLLLKQYSHGFYESVVEFTIKYNERWKKDNNFNAYATSLFKNISNRSLTDRRPFDLLESIFSKFGFQSANRADEQLLKVHNTPPDGEVYYIANAGLVLLHPFFPLFFERSGVMSGNQFISKQAADKAIHLLQFLVDSGEKPWEHVLLLNKILCGRQIDESVEKDILISEVEKDISISLLNGVRDNWVQLKNTSVDTFRAEFLQRQGKLRFYNGEWVLRIDQNGRNDYLLNTLPWSVGMIKSSWMPKNLIVEWI